MKKFMVTLKQHGGSVSYIEVIARNRKYAVKYAIEIYNNLYYCDFNGTAYAQEV